MSAFSAFGGDPGHLARWAAERQISSDGLLPPTTYRDYLSEVLARLQRRAAPHARVTRVDSLVVAIRRGCGRRALRLDLSAEGRVDADVVILATGGQATDLGRSRTSLGAAWGPGADIGTDDALLAGLLDSGLARPGKLGLGLHADAYGAVVDSARNVSSSLFPIGPLVAGTSQQAAGIQGIRQQAEALARHLVSRPAIAGPRSAA